METKANNAGNQTCEINTEVGDVDLNVADIFQ